MNLCPPKAKPHLPALQVQMVLAQEVDAPEGVEPIEWLLLTTMEVNSFQQACQQVAWYAQRWTIEVFHRTLKSGCNVEGRQLGHADRLKACLAIDMVIAWRIHPDCVMPYGWWPSWAGSWGASPMRSLGQKPSGAASCDWME